jgi:hypothetical protein
MTEEDNTPESRQDDQYTQQENRPHKQYSHREEQREGRNGNESHARGRQQATHQQQPEQNTGRRQLLKYGGATVAGLIGGYAIFGQNQDSTPAGQSTASPEDALVDKVVEPGETPLFFQLVEDTRTTVRVDLRESSYASVKVLDDISKQNVLMIDTDSGTADSFVAPESGQYRLSLLSDGATRVAVILDS